MSLLLSNPVSPFGAKELCQRCELVTPKFPSKVSERVYSVREGVEGICVPLSLEDLAEQFEVEIPLEESVFREHVYFDKVLLGSTRFKIGNMTIFRLANKHLQWQFRGWAVAQPPKPTRKVICRERSSCLATLLIRVAKHLNTYPITKDLVLINCQTCSNQRILHQVHQSLHSGAVFLHKESLKCTPSC